MELRMEKTTIDGIKIAYERKGKHMDMPMVLIHGYPLDHTIWNEASSILEKDMDLILPDLRGFGESEINESDTSIFRYAKDMVGLLDHLKIEKAFLVGHSMGGYVALAFARDFPERLSGLVLVSTQTVSDTSERKEGRLSTAKQVMEQGAQIVVESMTPKLSVDQSIQDQLKPLISRQKPLGISCALKAMADRSDTSELFASFKLPIVIVHGGADALIPVERAREMKHALPQAGYFEFSGSGHVPMMEKPSATAEALKSII
jgi:pimeloyl-ACP methyl ester carboxylesterase